MHSAIVRKKLVRPTLVPPEVYNNYQIKIS